MMEHGRRNISLSTVAPTGSLSLLAGTSSGLEPVYLLSYKRRRKVNTSAEDANVSFVDDMGDSWEEFTVYHPKAKQWMETTGNRSEEHTSELQSLMRISYAVFCLKKKKKQL